MIYDVISTLFILDAAIDGGFGEKTVIQHNAEHKHPEIDFLEYRFDDWKGDELVSSYPCHIVSVSLFASLSRAGVSGLSKQDVLVSKSEQFTQFSPDLILPEFYRLMPVGRVSTIPRYINYAKDFTKPRIWSGHDICLGPRAELIFSYKAIQSVDLSTIPTCRIRSFSVFHDSNY